ncbi:uncharacterized protein LOC121828996 isoform X2 [Peromyscus maniculatus bairdii]|uniref:uncharacterized protein LOC121828996 isoform X2 n=1 Tax=Peromyscus maniculatus bairdii TaxID=230844 RepID=UPI003FD63B96
MKNLVHGIKEKTPMGFCDVPRKKLLDILHDMKSVSVPNKPRYKPLKKIHQAASEGDVKRLQRMINLGKHSVHDRDFKERTALHFACVYGREEVVSVLLRNNCDIDAVDRNSITPLMKAVQNWTYGCMCTLLKHGADPNLMDKNGNTSLHYAVSEDNQKLAEYLLKYNADMEQKNKDGFTPLLLALKENNIEMAKFLVKKGANIHVFDKMKRNTLLYAIRWDSTDMVSLLLDEGIDFFFKDVFGWTALRYAIEGTSKGHHDDPTSGSTLSKSSEDDGVFDEKPSSSKHAPAKCPSNLGGAGDQRDKKEAKGTVEAVNGLPCQWTPVKSGNERTPMAPVTSVSNRDTEAATNGVCLWLSVHDILICSVSGEVRKK